MRTGRLAERTAVGVGRGVMWLSPVITITSNNLQGELYIQSERNTATGLKDAHHTAFNTAIEGGKKHTLKRVRGTVPLYPQ